MTITPGNANEALVRLGRIEFFDFPGHGSVTGTAGGRNQRVRDLPGAARLRIENVRLQVFAEQDDRQGTDQYEYQGEHPGIPSHQAKAQRPGVHASALSTRPYPTPRTVLMSLVGNGSSTLLLRWRT